MDMVPSLLDRLRENPDAEHMLSQDEIDGIKLFVPEALKGAAYVTAQLKKITDFHEITFDAVEICVIFTLHVRSD